MQEIKKQIIAQKEGLITSPLKSVKYRIELLKRLKTVVTDMQEEISVALKKDLNKSYIESYMCEIGLVLGEISYMLKHIKKLAKIKKVKTSLSQFPAKSYVMPCAYGQVLIISPWNYPFLLCLEPLIDAICAGNSVVIKPSQTSKYTQEVIEKIIKKTFTNNEVICVMGTRETSDFLLDLDWDYIFFTGGEKVGAKVLQKASERFIPVTLELGGKSPCIVDKSANILVTAKRIVFGKLINAGQTCIAPDYILCHSSVKEQLVGELKNQILAQYGNALENENYPKMINKRQFDSVVDLIEKDKVIFGGNFNEQTLKIEPTIINASYQDKVMQKEIFGPLIPIVVFDELDSVINKINSGKKPLAFYVFAEDKKVVNKLINSCDFGGGCINDTITHIISSKMPFGGVKNSGMGCYHGKYGFDTFTHYKSIVNKKTFFDMQVRYQPISKKDEKTIKKFLK